MRSPHAPSNEGGRSGPAAATTRCFLLESLAMVRKFCCLGPPPYLLLPMLSLLPLRARRAAYGGEAMSSSCSGERTSTPR